MRIAMFTNTYLPHVGGVATAVHTLEKGCRELGHEVRVIAPEFKDAVESPDVLRVPAIQNFNGSDFSVQLPAPNLIRDYIEDFKPDIIHSHHPFLLGDAALRESWKMDVPIVFTHHTLYERYTHYVPLDSPILKRVAIRLATEYCNLCDQVIAPSDSIERLLIERGVTTPIEAIPTGIDTKFFTSGNRNRFRKKHNIASGTILIGHVGRLALEKNLVFLAEAVGEYLSRFPDSMFLIVGSGDALSDMIETLEKHVRPGQLLLAGKLTGSDLADAYAAMDCFVFASQSETQGLVIAEAMAAGNPVVALDGPGVREIIRDTENGFLLDADTTPQTFASILESAVGDSELSGRMAKVAQLTADNYSRSRCIRRLVNLYERVIAEYVPAMDTDPMPWDRFLAGLEIEWGLFVEKLSAAAAGVTETQSDKEVSLD
jgi:1,2-diacylglycerol 3-alpha-glucosyltransferase